MEMFLFCFYLRMRVSVYVLRFCFLLLAVKDKCPQRCLVIRSVRKELFLITKSLYENIFSPVVCCAVVS